MDLANMRALGVRSGAVACSCGHRAGVDVSALPGEPARGKFRSVKSMWPTPHEAL